MIGRKWSYSDEADELNIFLDMFIEHALPEREIVEDNPDQAEEYLSYFIDQVGDKESKYRYSAEGMDEYPGVSISFSEFVSGYSDYEDTSAFSQIRVAKVTITPKGHYFYNKDAMVICYTLSGEGEVISGGRSRKCRKYDCILFDTSRVVQLRAIYGKPWECAVIRLTGRQSKSLFHTTVNRLENQAFQILTFGAGTRFRSIMWELIAPKRHTPDINTKISQHLLLALFTEIDIAAIAADNRLTELPDIIIDIQNFIDHNYTSEITLDSLAMKFNISKYHMSRLFKKYIGTSPIDYLIGVRIDRAKTLLVDSTRSISGIAELVGIPNTNTLLYQFKSREGISPSEFRKNNP